MSENGGLNATGTATPDTAVTKKPDTGDTQESGPGGTNENDLISIAQSATGALLSLFATVFGFVGISTGEVTAILRNEPERAPLVGLLLVLGLLAAVLTVVIKHQGGPIATPLDLALLIIFLLGIGTLIIWAIPVQSAKRLEWFWGAGGCAIAVVGLLCHFRLVRELLHLSESDKPGTGGKGEKKLSFLVTPYVHLRVLLIAASVMLIATSVDAGLRLETQSQLHTTVQVAASVAESESNSGSVTTLTLHLTAAKVTNDSSVRFEVEGIDYHEPQTVVRYIANGDMDPDVNGNVDNTLAIPLQSGTFDSIIIRTATCPVSASGEEASDPDYFKDCPMNSELTITNPVPSTTSTASAPKSTPTPTPSFTPNSTPKSTPTPTLSLTPTSTSA